MEGRKPTGVLMVLVNNTEPSKDAEFNKWYNDVHIPEVCATGSYYAATRYECTDTKPGEAKYLAIYETDWEDPDAAFTGMLKKTDDMDIWAHLEAVSLKTSKFIGPGAARQGKPTPETAKA